MSFALRRAWSDDLDEMVSLSIACQADPQRFCAYLSETEAAARADIADVIEWESHTLVALDDERTMIGWLLAETDPDMDRVWWWGPFVADGPQAEIVAEALLSKGLDAHARHSEHELAADGASALFATIAARTGFDTEEGSLALRRDDRPLDAPIGVDIVTAPSVDIDDAALITLHDQEFPGTHSSGTMLLRDLSDERALLVARVDGDLAGYVVTETQHDGSLYIDYLAVAPSHRNRGIGGHLVRAALARSPHSHAHLTVREGNAAARALYASLGFDEERLLVPYRKGFGLPSS